MRQLLTPNSSFLTISMAVSLLVLLLLCLFLLAALGKKNRLFGFSVFVTILVGVAAISVTRNDTVLIHGETMGTSYRVSVVVPIYISWSREFRDNLLKKKIDEELTRVNALMSTYDPNSELSRLNSRQSEEPFPISADTAKVLRLALEIAQKTNGAYDPTVGPLVNLWRFGPEDRPEKVPSDEEIAAARQRVGWDKIKIIEQSGDDSPLQYAVVKSDPNVYIDLSSVAKGFGVDCVAALLIQNRYKNFLVDVGGELRSNGKNVAGKDWSVGINSPVLTDNALAKTVSLSDKAIATSGDYLNFYELDGVRYSHIIDTQTGRPITHKTASVSVIDDSCMTADAWATALLALGAEQGKPLAEENGLHVIFLVRDGDEFVVESVNQE